jgi:hypothetical protein
MKMSIATIRTQIEIEINMAEARYNAASKALGRDGLDMSLIADGAWEMKGRDSKWRTVKIKKGKKAKVDKRHNTGMRDTAIDTIKAAGKPGSQERIDAYAAHYQNVANEGISPCTRTDEEIADALAGILVAKIQHARYDVDAIDDYIPEV